MSFQSVNGGEKRLYFLMGKDAGRLAMPTSRASAASARQMATSCREAMGRFPTTSPSGRETPNRAMTASACRLIAARSAEAKGGPNVPLKGDIFC